MVDIRDPEAAEEHIYAIRENIGICEGKDFAFESRLACLANDSLNHLANELYSQENHFLYELLQNADDTDYSKKVDPRLCLDLFHSKPRRLEVRSNEMGFKYDNVESLCNAHRSSKKTNPNTIGEKGIGFKSVFRVASKVEIRSNYYSFKFDTTENTALGHLRMIAPIWVPYDITDTDEDRYKGSHMKLFFRRKFDCSPLVSELMTFDFAFLLFSRKICSIKVRDFSEEGKVAQWRKGEYRGERNGIHKIRVSQRHMFSDDGTSEEEEDAPDDEEDSAEFEDDTSEEEEDAPEDEEDRVEFEDDTPTSDEDVAEGDEDNLESDLERKEASSTKYFRFRHNVKHMPKTAKREGVTNTAIDVAFPFNSEGIILQSQPTFAFLPIRHHGFTFIIHADFALTANRGDIDEGLAWNKHLRDKVAPAFVEACLQLSKQSKRPPKDKIPDFRFLWPQYVPCLASSSIEPFFKPVWRSVIDELKLRRAVITEGNHLEIPTNCYTVGSLYRDAHRKLLLGSDFMEKAVVSTRYPPKSLKGLGQIGVKDFGAEDFVNAFSKFVESDEGRDYRQMSSAWHEKVSMALCTALENIKKSWPGSRTLYPRFLKTLRRCAIVPLRDGSWASVVSGEIFLENAGTAASLHIPGGIDMRIVHDSAAGAECRRSLLLKLGVQNCDTDHICKLILQVHSQERPPSLEPAVWISHAKYLFEKGYPASGLQYGYKLRLVDRKNKPRSGGRIYMPFGKPGNLFRQYFSESCSSISLLHSKYSNAVQQQRQEGWYHWLTKWSQVATLPPLHRKGVLSDEARFVFKRGSKLFLAFMKDSNLKCELLALEAQVQLKKDISGLRVSTHSGSQTHLLRECALPEICSREDAFLHPLDLEKPSDAYWRTLHVFGVVTEVNLQYHLQHLLHLRNQAGPAGDIFAPVHQVVGMIYKDIEKHAGGNEVEVINIFECSGLIFVDSARGDSHWVAPSKCVWKATFDCSAAVVLSTEYKEYRTFFRDLLNIKDAGLDTIIEQIEICAEVGREATSNSVRDAQQLLLALDRLLRRSSPSDEQIKRLKCLPCIPVWRGCGADRPKETKFVCPSNSFYIADRGALYKAFSGVIWMPDFADYEEILEKLQKVIQHLDLRKRFLSVACVPRVEIEGTPEFDEEATRSLRSKIPSILRILRWLKVPLGGPSSISAWKKRLETARIFRVKQVILHRAIRPDPDESTDLEVQGRVDNGKVAISDTESAIKIYVQRTDALVSPFSLTLNEKLSEHLGLNKDDKTARAFSTVMMTDDNGEVQEELEKQGIWSAGYDHMPQEPNRDDSDTDDNEDDRQGHSISNVRGVAEDGDDTSSFTHGAELRTPRRNDIRFNNSPRAVRNEDIQDEDPSNHPSSARLSHRRDGSGTPLFRTEAKTIPSMEEIEKAMASCMLLDTTPLATNDISRRTEASVGRQSAQAHDLGRRLLFPSPSSDGLLDDLTRDVTAIRITSPPREEDKEQAGSQLLTSDAWPNDGELLTPTTHRSYNAKSGRPARPRRLSSSIDPEYGPLPYKKGFYGELFTFKFLSGLLGPGFSEENWTSKYRSRVFYNNKFEQMPKDYADFTYTEVDGAFGAYLSERGLFLNMPAPTTTYHIEVKASTGGLSSAFMMSTNQINLARRYSASETDIYLIFRVYNLVFEAAFTGKMQIFVDPWRMICEERLILGGQNKIDISPVGF